MHAVSSAAGAGSGAAAQAARRSIGGSCCAYAGRMAFQCTGTFPEGADLAALGAEAAVLTELAAACGECVTAGHEGSGLRSVCEGRLCGLAAE